MSQDQKTSNPSRLSKLESELAEIQKELAVVNARIESRKGPKQLEFDELRIRNARRSDQRLADLRNSAIGRVVEGWVFGDKGSTRQEVQNAQDIASFGQITKMLGNIKDDKFLSDPYIKDALGQLRVNSLLYQYYSANSHDAAQDRFIYDVPLWTLGYQWGGIAGAGLAALSSLNRSASSEANFYQLQKMRLKMTSEYLDLQSRVNHYGLNKNREWLKWDELRGAVSVDRVRGRARIEYQNMQQVPHDAYAKSQNLRMNHEAAFLSTQAQYEGEQARLKADLFLGLGALGL